MAHLRGYKHARPSHIKIQREAKPRCWKTGVSPGDHRRINQMLDALSSKLILGANPVFEHRRKDTLFAQTSGERGFAKVPTLPETQRAGARCLFSRQPFCGMWVA